MYIYKYTYIFGGPPAMSKARPPTSMPARVHANMRQGFANMGLGFSSFVSLVTWYRVIVLYPHFQGVRLRSVADPSGGSTVIPRCPGHR